MYALTFLFKHTPVFSSVPSSFLFPSNVSHYLSTIAFIKLVFSLSLAHTFLSIFVPINVTPRSLPTSYIFTLLAFIYLLVHHTHHSIHTHDTYLYFCFCKHIYYRTFSHESHTKGRFSVDIVAHLPAIETMLIP